MSAATGGDLEIEVAPENQYVLAGLADDLGEGPDVVDAEQLELAVELVIDAAAWAGEKRTREDLAPSESLGLARLVRRAAGPDAPDAVPALRPRGRRVAGDRGPLPGAAAAALNAESTPGAPVVDPPAQAHHPDGVARRGVFTLRPRRDRPSPGAGTSQGEWAPA